MNPGPGSGPPLVTARLRLDPLSPAHAETIAEAYLDPRMWTYFPALRPAGIAALRDRIQRWCAGPAGAGGERWLNWAAFERAGGGAAGTFQATIRSDGTALLGYSVFPASQRRGYAVEGMQAVTAHLAAAYGVATFIAEMDARNRASIRVATSLGMREVARAFVDDQRTGARGVELRYEGSPSST